MKPFLILALLMIQSWGAFAHIARRDSIGLERRNDQIYVLHRIDPGETLYSITRRYKVSEEMLKTHNPTADFKALRVGQIIRIPATLQGGYANSPQPPVISKPDQGFAGGGASKRTVGYIVRTGDSVYKIARAYGTTQERIMELNRMKDDKIAPGQTILIEVSGSGEVEVAKKEEQPVAQGGEETPWWAYRPAEKGDDKKAEKADDKAEDKEERKDIKGNKMPTLKRVVSFGEMIQGNSMIESGKLLAMHSTAHVGTFIKITNTNNGKTAVVKVIANIPAAEASKDLNIKLSKAACDALGIKDTKFQVLLEYND